MSPITALLHTKDDAVRLGRALETLYPCDDIVVVDHGSHDRTASLARAYGARVVTARPGISPHHYLQSLPPGWILCLDPRESLTESLAASLFELKSDWKSRLDADQSVPAFSVCLREETAEGWTAISIAQTRLVPYNWARWHNWLPVHDPVARALEGELLRFAFP